MTDEASSIRAKRRDLSVRRGFLLVAVGALLVDAGIGASGPAALALLVGFAASDLALFALPLRVVATRRFDAVVALLDLGLVGLGITLAGPGGGGLPVSCLLMVLVVALGTHGAHVVAGGTAVGALHAWLVLARGSETVVGHQLALQILFLTAVGIHYAALAEDAHRFRPRHLSEDVQRLRPSMRLPAARGIGCIWPGSTARCW